MAQKHQQANPDRPRPTRVRDVVRLNVVLDGKRDLPNDKGETDAVHYAKARLAAILSARGAGFDGEPIRVRTSRRGSDVRRTFVFER